MTYKVNEKHTIQISTLASIGMPIKRIAKYLGISHTTLTKYYQDVLDVAQVDKDAQVALSLFESAVEKGSVPAQIFWCKCRLGWRETSDSDEKKYDKDISKIQIEVIGAEVKPQE